MAKSKDNRVVKRNRSTAKLFKTIKNQKCLHLCVWSVFAVGLCIAVAFFCIIISRNDTKNGTSNKHIPENLLEKSNNDSFAYEHFGIPRGLKSLSINYNTDLDDSSEQLRDLCVLRYCSATCTNVSNIYRALHETLPYTRCSTLDILFIINQEFPEGVLRNNWFPTNVSVNVLSIRASNITAIENNAFNSALFKHANQIMLLETNITKVESGAFLGLEKLQTLIITSHIEIFEPTVIQPIETTLTRLVLSANLNINGNENFLNGTLLNKLNELNLSYNKFNGSLGKNLLASTPNLKTLIIIDSQIEHIDDDAFENIREKLEWLDVSDNRITTLRAAVLKPFFDNHNNKKVIRIYDNDYVCNCDLEDLAQFINIHQSSFVVMPRCKSPDHLEGRFLNKVNFTNENCSNSDYEGDPTPESSTMPPDTLNMVCLDTQFAMKEKMTIEKADSNNYLSIPPPNYDFDLKLITENNSVIVSIDRPADVFVIWFSDQLESSVVGHDDMSFDYECMRYAEPKLTVGPLQDNTTYTFCLLPSLKEDISPFNCLPLFVPPKNSENIWISKDKRQLTIGMLCFIFLLSTLAGGLIAYFGIRTYPHLLEGSKNVLVIKKSNQAQYIATISEAGYEKKSFYKKNKRQSFTRQRLPETPTPNVSRPLSVRDLQRISALKLTSSCSEDIPPRYSFVNDDYEIPKVCNSKSRIEQRNGESNRTPSSPPPLPKRNEYLRME